jgi:hypothetical protein
MSSWRPVGCGDVEPPDVPGFRTWRSIYLVVFAWFLLVVALLTAFTEIFS